MGSTVVALLVHGARYAILWVGDSRAYVLRGGALIQLSRDHSQVQEMVDRGIMRPEDADDHPMGHILSRAVGVRDDVAIDRATGDVEPGDIFLLCSDGLHGYVDKRDITRLLAQRHARRGLGRSGRDHPRQRRARQRHGHRGLGDRGDHSLPSGFGERMSDDKNDKRPDAGDERTVFVPADRCRRCRPPMAASSATARRSARRRPRPKRRRRPRRRRSAPSR